MNNNIDFDKTLRDLRLYLLSIPIKFLAQSFLLYKTMPMFFGTSFTNGFLTSALLVGGLWVCLPNVVLAQLGLAKLKRYIFHTINPTLAEQSDLASTAERRKRIEELMPLTAQKFNLLRFMRRSFSGVHLAFLRILFIVSIGAWLLPDIFVIRTPEGIVKFTALFVFFEWVVNTIQRFFIIDDSGRGPSKDAERKRKPSALSVMLSEVYDERAVEITRYQLAVETNPCAETYLQRGIALLRMRETLEAIEDFDRVIQLDPACVEAYEHRADAYQTLNYSTLARNDLVQAYNVAQQQNLDSLPRIQEKLTACASPEGFAGIHGYPSLKRAWSTVFVCFDPQKKEQDNTTKKVGNDPTDRFSAANVYLHQAEYQSTKNNFEEALHHCDQAMDCLPDYAPVFRTRGKIFFQMGDYRRAVRNFDRAIDLESLDEESWKERARTKVAMEDFNGAVSDCTHALKISRSYDFYLLRGTALLALKRSSECVDDLTLFIKRWEGFIAFFEAFWLPFFRTMANSLRIDLKEAYELRAAAYEHLDDLDRAAQDAISIQKIKEKLESKKPKRSLQSN